MRIDAHQHFWRYDPLEYPWIDDSLSPLRRDFLPPDLHPLLLASGFQACVAVQARQSIRETLWLLELASQFPFIAGVVGWVNLRSPSLRDDLSQLTLDPLLVGVRHIVQGEPDDLFLLLPDFLRGVAALAEFDLPYDILIYPRHLPVAAEFAARFPEQRFVLDHLAKPDIRSHSLEPWRSHLRALASLPNVFAKLSGLVTEADWSSWSPSTLVPYLDTALELFGPDRLLIGSDWPVCTVAGSYSRVLDAILSFLAPLPSSQQDAILGGNALRLWKLHLPS